MSGEAGRRDEPDVRPRCPRCHGLGTPTSSYEQSTTGRTRWCETDREYFGAEPHNQGEPE